MSNPFSQVLATFMEEGRELLEQMETLLLRAETEPLSADDLHALFRCAHTIKGSAGMFGFVHVVGFTHNVESVLDKLRNQQIEANADCVALLLKCRDHIAQLLENIEDDDAIDRVEEQQLTERLRHLLGGGGALHAAPVSAGGQALVSNDHEERCWHISLRFAPDVMQNGLDPIILMRYLNTFGEVTHIEPVLNALPTWDEADPSCCYIGFELSFLSNCTKQDIENAFEFILDDSRVVILPPARQIEHYIEMIDGSGEDAQRLGELLLACGSITEHELQQVLQRQKQQNEPAKVGEILLQQGSVHAPVVEAALLKQKKNEEKKIAEAKNIKVPADRLDALIDQVGELVIAGAATQLQSQQLMNRELQEITANMLRLVEQVRDTALGLRMIPIGEVFSRFPRVVRDVTKELGKDVELVIRGAETEMDKSMVEKIGDPLMHLVRNSLDHGIENPAQRRALGKTERGTVMLSAYHDAGSIVIEISDDGGGLNREKIQRKAIEKGLLSADKKLSDYEIDQLILLPGFSTADNVTNLSGRGVGMDVVKTQVDVLRGSLQIHSTPGEGTVMRITLPLTLAIIDGFQIALGGNVFVLPLDSVIECIELPTPNPDGNYLNLRGEVLPLLPLRELFAVDGVAPSRQNVVVAGFAQQRVGLVVDQLLGECQTVIKPLGDLFSSLRGVSGSTILGNGSVALILDVARLMQQASVVALSGSSPRPINVSMR